MNTKNPLGQYFTPLHVAEAMVEMIQGPKSQRVLEPCSGQGVFLQALESQGFTNITAIEIDSEVVRNSKRQVINASFVSWEPDGRFDTVIGNPPYIRWKNLGPEQKDELVQSSYWGQYINSLSDYLNIFILKSVDHLDDGGQLIFITPSFWFHTQHSETLRNFLLSRGQITHVVHFGESTVFDGVNSSIIIFRFEKNSHSHRSISLYRYSGERRIPKKLSILQHGSPFEMEKIPQFKTKTHWTLANRKTQVRLNNFESWCSSQDQRQKRVDSEYFAIGDFCDIANGMVSGLDKAFRVPVELEASLSVQEKSATIQVLKASNIERLSSKQLTRYINLPKGLSEQEVISEYPLIFAHLLEYREELDRRYSYGGNLAFWDWAFRRSEGFLTNGSRKIFVPCKERLTSRQHVRFTIAPVGSVATQDVTAFSPEGGTKESLEYLAAFLCLPEVTEWIRERGLMKGGVAEFSERPLSQIPFRPINWNLTEERRIHEAITSLVKKWDNGTRGHSIFDDLRNYFERLGLPES